MHLVVGVFCTIYIVCTCAGKADGESSVIAACSDIAGLVEAGGKVKCLQQSKTRWMAAKMKERAWV